MDKVQKEILQVAKELTAKFIETRTVSPNNFAEVFPMIYRVVRGAACRDGSGEEQGQGVR
jgi:aspartate oxidase